MLLICALVSGAWCILLWEVSSQRHLCAFRLEVWVKTLCIFTERPVLVYHEPNNLVLVSTLSQLDVTHPKTT